MLAQRLSQGQRLAAVVLCALLLAVAGCAAGQRTPPPPRGADVGETVVFGRVVVVEGGTPLAYGASSALEPEFSVIRIADDRTFTVRLAPDGAFAAVLPRGAYVIDQVAGRFRVPMGFAPPADAEAAYVGTLELHVARTRTLFGTRLAPERLALHDDGSHAGVPRALMQGASAIPGAQARLAARRRGLTAGDVLQAIIIGR